MTEINQNVGTETNPFVKGDSLQITVAVVDEAGAPKNMTGLTNKRWQAWVGGVQKIVKANADISLVNVTATNDGLRFELTPGDTISLPPDIYDHELEVVDANGKVSTVMKGKLQLTDHLIV